MYLENNPSDSTIIRMLRSAIIIAFAVIVIVIIATLVIGFQLEHTKVPPLLGNRFENVKYMQSHIDPNNYSFIVISEVKDSTRTFKSLLDIAKCQDPSFIVILGDLVNHIDSVDHKLFVSELSQYASKIPFFIIPGDHDCSVEGRFGLKDFEHLYGPAQFSFTIGQDLFIFLNNLPDYNLNGEYLEFLENTLRSNEVINKKIFVFMHIPPGNLNPLLECSAAPFSNRFKEIVKKYNIDYVFAGDHHGFIKTISQGTNYIVTGGGGARLKGTKGAFHHFVELNIENQNISENIISVQHKSDGLKLLQRNIAAYFWATAKENKLVYNIGILYCIVSLFTSFVFIKKKWKRN